MRDDAVKNLLDFKKIMDEASITFCLTEGTLLGVYREGDFIAWDTEDIDTMVPHKEYDRFIELEDKLKEAGFEVLVGSCIVMPDKQETRDISEGRVEGSSLRRGQNHMCVSRLHILRDYAYNIGRGAPGRFGLPRIWAYKFPKECFSGWDWIDFLDTKFRIPQNVEKFLEARYANWKVPVRSYDWTSPFDVPCISTDWEWEE